MELEDRRWFSARRFGLKYALFNLTGIINREYRGPHPNYASNLYSATRFVSFWSLFERAS